MSHLVNLEVAMEVMRAMRERKEDSVWSESGEREMGRAVMTLVGVRKVTVFTFTLRSNRTLSMNLVLLFNNG